MAVRKIFIRFCNNIRHFSNEINKHGGWISFCGGRNFSKSVSVDSTFIREMRVPARVLMYLQGILLPNIYSKFAPDNNNV